MVDKSQSTLDEEWVQWLVHELGEVAKQKEKIQQEIDEKAKELTQLQADLRITRQLVWEAEADRKLFKSLQTSIDRLFESVDLFIVNSGRVEMECYYTQLFGKQPRLHLYAQRLREAADKLEGVVPTLEWSGRREVDADTKPPPLQKAGGVEQQE